MSAEPQQGRRHPGAVETQPERGHTVGTRVRTTITPGKVLEVEAAELLDLDRDSLILSREGDDDWVDDAEPESVESGVITDANPGEPPVIDAASNPDDKPGKGKSKGKADEQPPAGESIEEAK